MADQKCFPPVWHLKHLRTHLENAVGLEFWTIPYYMTTMYSIRNPASEAFQLIRSVVYQEMLHMELAANLFNAYCKKEFRFLKRFLQYKKIPVLDFKIDTPNPLKKFPKATAELGPLDLARIDTMCLIEYPEWLTERTPRLEEDINKYGSIAEFYQALEFGMTELVAHLKGGRNQLDVFRNFYQDFKHPIITKDGKEGLKQACNLVWAITDQGEGQTMGDKEIPAKYRNTADDPEPSWSHYRKFLKVRRDLLRDAEEVPGLETYSGTAVPEKGSPGHEAQKQLIGNFKKFLAMLEDMINTGQPPGNFGSLMPTIGANILSCWQNGAIPKFYQD
ncbi:MAG: ferritin-like domain-containing protein [Acidobacteriota bacterium]|nr:ferritin-like domain-containing protein [Acidobacteriota bacterium]